MRSLLTPLLAASASLLTVPAVAQTVTFEFIPTASSANDMTPDGRYVVGERVGGEPYRYDTTTNMMIALGLPGLSAAAVSDDGSVILGNVPDPENPGSHVVGIWTEGEGWETIGALPEATCLNRSSAYELSADGTVAVGLSWDGCNGRGFRWSEATGMIALEELANGTNRASVVSADGNVIGGFAQGSFSRTPAMWNGSGVGELLDPPDGDVLGEIHGMSDDGSVLLGEWDGDAVLWTSGGGAEVIANGQLLPGWIGIPTDIADNGTIVGFDFLLGNRRAWIRPAGMGAIQLLTNYIEVHGGTVPPTALMQVCQAISVDGDLICGHGGGGNAWLVRIDFGLPCDGDADGNDTVDFQDLLLVLANWGACVDCPADVDGNDMVDFQDLLIVLANWGPCP